MQDMKRLLKYLGPYRKDMLIGALLIFAGVRLLLR